MSVRAVVFDIGGVLEYTPDLGLLPAWSERLGLTPDEFSARIEPVITPGNVGAVTLAEVHAGLATALGIDASTVDALMDDVWREYLGSLNAELVDYVRGLRPRYRTAILSNSFVGAREREQEAYGFEDLVELIVYSHEVGLEKPDPRIFQLTCERLAVRPDEVVFVDDVAGHVEAAGRLGIRGVLFQDNAQTIAGVESLLGS